jgi:cytochrome c-type biogenesis protein CcmH
MSGYAEALAMTSNMVLAGKPIEMVQQALKADPNDIKALELAGIYAFQNEEFAQAVVLLDRLQRLMSSDVPYAQEILKMRNEAQRLAEMGGAAPSASAGRPAAATSQASVSGSVEVAAALRSRVDAKSTLYVIARAGEGGPPLAAARVTLGPFPIQFRLDNTMAMNPANTLSNHKEVVLVARVSKTGNPIAQPGDLEGKLAGVKVGATGVKLVIDQVVP